MGMAIFIIMSMISSEHGFTFMDKQLLLAAMHLRGCRFKPHIESTEFVGSIFRNCSTLPPDCSGGSVGRQESTYLHVYTIYK